MSEFVFPQGYTEHGLTKREYFAGLAMQGFYASASAMENAEKMTRKAPDMLMPLIASIACKQADALIAALNTEPQP